MSDLRELYQEVILDHSRQPRNFRRPDKANREAKGDNPLCGDKVAVFLTIEDGKVADVGFQGRGCAIGFEKLLEQRQQRILGQGGRLKRVKEFRAGRRKVGRLK